MASQGRTPAVVLVNPKYPRNVGGAYRSCAALGAEQLWYTGDRAAAQWEAEGRLPREERLRAYRHVELIRGEGRFLRQFPGATIVAVEVDPGAQVLTYFEHPDEAVYVFGPEDGTLPKGIRTACHQFVIIPSDTALNLYSAVTSILLHRRITRQLAGLEPVLPAYATMGGNP
jgi:tRNA(Leu) C34 or U34 (ribose-2'-O)-methylase TrmL